MPLACSRNLSAFHKRRQARLLLGAEGVIDNIVVAAPIILISITLIPITLIPITLICNRASFMALVSARIVALSPEPEAQP